jgi:outer membrane receptor protein involved in Fe transport
MTPGSIFKHLSFSKILMIMASPAIIFPISIQAQQLEEIVVTAQRREQSIQEVPISLEAYTGDTLNKQGFRTMEDLSSFSPSVEIDVRTQDQDIAIRGMGTIGNNLGLEGAVPTFVDGIHYARTSMIMGAFLDLERVEVLRGPQPIAFGQNATAGAFSLTTRKPTAEWEGDVTAEYGNWERFSLEGGVGGPISDTWGVRLAAQFDKSGGYITDVITGSKFPAGTDMAGRATFVWSPTENLQATFKAEVAIRRNEAEGNSVCRTHGTVQQTERAFTIRNQTDFPIEALNFPDDCDTNGFGRRGIKEGSQPLASPVDGVNQEDSYGGFVNMTKVSGTIMGDLDAHDDMEFYNYRIGVDYEFANGITLFSNTGYEDYQRTSAHDNSSSPVITNVQHRGEVFDLMSQEFRFTSPRGGAIEWEAGAFFQAEDIDIGNLGDPKYQTITLRANTRRPARSQDSWQDTRWFSGFGSVTFNFMDDRASLDIGARFSDIRKTSHVQGYGHTWIYDIDPDSVAVPIDPRNGKPTGDVVGDGIIWGIDHEDSCFDPGSGVNRCQDRARLVGGIGVDATGNTSFGANSGLLSIIDCGDAADPRTQGDLNYCGSYGAGFWTHAYNPGRTNKSGELHNAIADGRGIRTVPEAWDLQHPVALSPPIWGNRSQTGNNQVYNRLYTDNSIDPQITLRYRPSDTLSLYAKYARAFKGGGADISTASLPSNQDAFPLLPETATNWEVGAKGTLLDGSANFNITAFQINIKDLQLATSVPQGLETQSSITTNAGEQRTRGIEFDARWAATEHLILGVAGAFMRGKMVSYPGAGCRDDEFEVADTGPCVSKAEAAADPDGFPAGTIDRTGFEAPRTPKYKIITDVDWWYPITDNLKYTFASKVTFVDGFIYEVEDFAEHLKYGDRTLINLNVGLSSMDENWNVNLWVRNLLSEGFTYYPEFDQVDPRGRVDKEVSQRHWASYGIQFQYKFR